MKKNIKTVLITLGLLFVLTPINTEADSIQQKSEVVEQTTTAKYENNNEKIENILKENKSIVKKYNKKVKIYCYSLKSYKNFNPKKKLRYKFTFKESYNIFSFNMYGGNNLDPQIAYQENLIEDISKENKRLKKEIKAIKKETQKIRKKKKDYINNQKKNPTWKGAVLNSQNGVVTGPCGKETYYNLNMSGVVSIMRSKGNKDKYWVRKDGCKMLGDYIMVAANLKKYPRGTIVETSLGKGIICDTGGFASNGSGITFDIATSW